MIAEVKVFARDKEGKLAIFKLEGAESYTNAIDTVKDHLEVDRALCLAYPTPLEEVA